MRTISILALALVPIFGAKTARADEAAPAAPPVPPGATASPTAEKLSLANAVRMALENNERAKKARLRVETAAGSLV
jgi:hypothetical protein